MSEKLHLADSMMGLAPGAGPDRNLAYIFYNRVQELQREQSAAFERKNTEFTFYVADLLGSATAHEVGHILLNLAVHSISTNSTQEICLLLLKSRYGTVTRVTFERCLTRSKAFS